MLTNKQKKQIRDQLPNYDSCIVPGTVWIMGSGEVTAVYDPMPNTNHEGRAFVGWDTDVLALLEQEDLI